MSLSLQCTIEDIKDAEITAFIRNDFGNAFASITFTRDQVPETNHRYLFLGSVFHLYADEILPGGLRFEFSKNVWTEEQLLSAKEKTNKTLKTLLFE